MGYHDGFRKVGTWKTDTECRGNLRHLSWGTNLTKMGDGSLRLGYGQGRAGKRQLSGTSIGSRYPEAGKRKPKRVRIVLQTLTALLSPKGEETPTPGLRVLLLDPKCPVNFARGKIGRAETKVSLV